MNVRKFGLAAVAALASMGVAAASASAAPVTASGTIDFRGSVVTSRCNVNLAGDRVGSTITVTSGSTSGCSVGSVALSFTTPWTATLDASGGTFDIARVVAALTAPIVGTCSYAGGLSGDYDGALALTITGDSLAKTGGGALCTSNPTISGDITLSS